jgi:hypothetical protein
MTEIAEFFAGNRNLGVVVQDETYEQWFREEVAK